MLRHSKLIALAAGALSATGFAPLGLWPVALACFALLLALIARAPGARGAFMHGWLFGLGHFTVGLNWIAHAFTYQEAMPHWFGYGAVIVLSLYLAVYPGLAALAAWAAAGKSRAANGIALALFFAAAWIVTEWLRATLFTGFAWNPLAAIALAPADSHAQGLAGLSRWFGTYAVSGLVVLFAAGWWWLLRWGWRVMPPRRWGTIPRKIGIGLIVVAAPISLWAIGPPRPPVAPQPLAVRIVQPNVSQDEKYAPGAQAANLKRLVDMSAQASGRGAEPRLLLWPEAAIDNGFLLAEEPALRRSLAQVLGPDMVLLTGGVALEYDAGGRARGGRNSVFAMDADGRIHARYDKAHLVPYGEYLPMRALLTPLGLSRLVPGDLDFWPGPGPRTFALPGIGAVGFQVCYEIIFSGQVIDPDRRPRFLFNPSNDAWFGAWGPPQHMAQARLRAIEEGMTIVRATPTGISGVIAPDGRLVARIGLAERAVLDARLPAANPPTLFARHGNWLAALMALALGGLAVVIRLRAR